MTVHSFRLLLWSAVLIGAACAGAILWSASASALAVTAPASTNLGSHATGAGTLTAQLGTVTATNSGVVIPNVVASVSCSAFTTGGGTANETIPCSAISYWSGPATSVTGLTGTPGQLTSAQAVTLASTRTAFTGTGLALSISVSWNPTLIVNIPASAVAGTYTGTITHSVA